MSMVTTLHNFLYADRKGNIAYFGDGLVPIEPARVDPRLPGAGRRHPAVDRLRAVA